MSELGAVRVGNDVVDLHHPRCRGKAEDRRFLERVLAAPEREAVLAAGDAHRSLWLCWAAKEAAFKVAWKLRGRRPAFAHPRFQAQRVPQVPACPPGCACQQEITLAVSHEGLLLSVRATLTHVYVHAVAAAAGDGELPAAELPVHGEVTRVTPDELAAWRSPAALARHFSPPERATVHTPEAALVRIRAREAIARHLGIRTERVRIVRADEAGSAGPPAVEVDGEPVPVDVSLSHHGGFVAWAFWAGR